MPKIPDFSKFDLQSIVNSVKSMINPEIKVPEGDFIGTKIVEITKLVQEVSKLHDQAAKDLNRVNDLLSMLYSELDAFRKQTAEKQPAEPSSSATSQTTTAQAPKDIPASEKEAKQAREGAAKTKSETTTKKKSDNTEE